MMQFFQPERLAARMTQQTLTAQLNRSKALTRPEVKTPIIDGLNAAAKAHGIDSSELVAKYISGEIKLPSVDADIAASQETAMRIVNKVPAARPSPPAAPQPLMTTPSMPTTTKPAPQAATTTAAQFATPKLTITREDFRSLTPQDKGRFVKSGGTLV
jgi:hypothetical protein